MIGSRSKLGWVLIIAGMFYLIMPTLASLPPLSTVSIDLPIGTFKVSGISELFAVNTFIGLVLIAMGIFVNMRQHAV